MWCRSPTGRQTCPSRSDPDRGYFSTRPKGCQTREITGSGSVSTVAAVYEVCSFLCCTGCLKYDRQKGRSMCLSKGVHHHHQPRGFPLGGGGGRGGAFTGARGPRGGGQGP